VADISLDELAQNAGNPAFGDDRLLVKFSLEPVQDQEETLKQGRPVFKDEEFIRIRIPGDKSGEVYRRIRPQDKQRFARAYAHWKSTGEGERVVGTPLALWPAVTRSQVEELAYFGVKTVEALAGLADVHAQKFPGINALRDKAKRFVQAAADNAPMERMQAMLSERDNTIATLQAAMEDMKAQLAELRKARR
jgi:hypothetical protein